LFFFSDLCHDPVLGQEDARGCEMHAIVRAQEIGGADPNPMTGPDDAQLTEVGVYSLLFLGNCNYSEYEYNFGCCCYLFQIAAK
jgi:hypothetical protein